MCYGSLVATPEWNKRNHEKVKKHRRDWYSRNAEKAKKAVVERKRRLREWMNTKKESLSCSRCGESHPSCIQFHHTDPSEKDINLAKAVSRGWSIKRMKQEISKCEVVCANCHFKEHWEDK